MSFSFDRPFVSKFTKVLRVRQVGTADDRAVEARIAGLVPAHEKHRTTPRVKGKQHSVRMASMECAQLLHIAEPRALHRIDEGTAKSRTDRREHLDVVGNGLLGIGREPASPPLELGPILDIPRGIHSIIPSNEYLSSVVAQMRSHRGLTGPLDPP